MLFYLSNISDQESNINYMQLIISTSCIMRKQFAVNSIFKSSSYVKIFKYPSILPSGFGKSLLKHCGSLSPAKGGDACLVLPLTLIGGIELMLSGWTCRKKCDLSALNVNTESSAHHFYIFLKGHPLAIVFPIIMQLLGSNWQRQHSPKKNQFTGLSQLKFIYKD